MRETSTRSAQLSAVLITVRPSKYGWKARAISCKDPGDASSEGFDRLVSESLRLCLPLLTLL